MRIESDRRYRFPVGHEELWAAISKVDDYPRWWPWLRRFEGEGLVAGDVWRCVVQPPLPYRLRFTITIDEVDPAHHVTATVGGDITGTARLEITPNADGCHARLSSALAPGSPVFRAVAVGAKPLVRFGHDWVLDTGAQQFVARAV